MSADITIVILSALLLLKRKNHRNEVRRKNRLLQIKRKIRKNRALRRKKLISQMDATPLFILYLFAGGLFDGRSGRIACLPKSRHWWDVIVPLYRDDTFQQNFRLPWHLFFYVCEELQNDLEKKDSNFKEALTVEHRVAMTLWRLGSDSTFREIGEQFGVGRSTACVCFWQVLSAIFDVLCPQYLNFPNAQEMQRLSIANMNNQLMPNSGLAIDGCDIYLPRPPRRAYPRDYYSRKKRYCIIMQAVVDAFKCFRDVNIGWPGSVHDARVFANSDLYDRGTTGRLFPIAQPQFAVPNYPNIPLYILADKAYPQLGWIMRAIDSRTRNFGAVHRDFNAWLSEGRVVVENAFADLKNIFRCLLKRNDSEIENTHKVVLACVILHNVLKSDGTPQPSFVEPNPGMHVPQIDGLAARNDLFQYFQDVVYPMRNQAPPSP